MADIKFNFDFDNLEEGKKFLAELKKASESIAKNIAKVGKITDDDATKAKKLATEALKVENAYKRTQLQAQKVAQSQERINQKQVEGKGIIGSLEAEVRRLRSAYKSAQTEAGKNTARKELERVNKELQKAKGTTATWGKALGSFQFKFNALGNIAANVLSKMSQGAKEFARDAIKMASEADGVRIAFQKLNKPSLLDDLIKATRGTVNNLDLMKRAVQANNFKIPLDQLATYFAFATNRAIETGESVDYLVESIITGIGRKSVLVMDNLGISAVELQQETKRVGDFGQAAGNIIQKEMGKAGEVMDTVATSASQLAAEWDNLKVTTGELLTKFLRPGLVELNKTLDKMGILNEDSDEGAKRFAKISEELKDLSKEEKITEISRLLEENNQIWDQQIELYKQAEKVIEEGSRKERKAAKDSIEITSEKLGVQRDLVRLLEEYYESLLKVEKKTQETFDITNIKPIVDIELNDLDEARLSDWVRKNDIGAYQNEQLEDNADERLKILQKQWKEEADQFAEKERDKAKLAEEIANKQDAIEKLKQKAQQETFNKIKGFASSLSALTEANKQKELSAAGDNAEKRLAIEKEYQKKQQAIAISEALIGGSVAAVNALKLLPNPLAFVLAGLAATQTAIEIATIKSQKFAKGGWIDGKPHSEGGTIIEAEKGEFVINRRSSSKYPRLIEGINEDNQLKILSSLRMDKAVQTNHDPYNRKIYEALVNKAVYGETNDFYIIEKGNQKLMIKKK